MKLTMKLWALFFGVLMWGTVGYAQTPREQLKQMVEQLQKAPNDNALREKIIKLATSIKPAPAIPEEAVRRMARGEVAFESAKESADFAKAVDEFQAATDAAPWMAAAYFNLGSAQEKAGRPSQAMDAFRLYLLAAPEAKDAAEVKKRLFKLEYAAEQQSPAAVAAREKEAEQRFIASLEGAKYICPEDNTTSFYADNRTDVVDRVEIDIKNGKVSGANVTTWISPRGLRDSKAGGSLYVGFRGAWWWGEIPAQRIVNVKGQMGEMRVEIYDDRLVYQQQITHTRGTDVQPAETCLRSK